MKIWVDHSLVSSGTCFAYTFWHWFWGCALHHSTFFFCSFLLFEFLDSKFAFEPLSKKQALQLRSKPCFQAIKQRASIAAYVLARLVRNLSCLLVISCCLFSGVCFRSKVYSLFFCKPHNSRDKSLLVALLNMLHLEATCKQKKNLCKSSYTLVVWLFVPFSEWRTCQLTAVTKSHLKPSCACLFIFLLLPKQSKRLCKKQQQI